LLYSTKLFERWKDNFLELTEIPSSILFIGGGFISFEFAHFVARLGPANHRSVILEAADRPLEAFDSELVELLMAASKPKVSISETASRSRRLNRMPKGFQFEQQIAAALKQTSWFTAPDGCLIWQPWA
jgi:pyruvate/2-oxoglutarate dehydrogenase complex dihydrolipoamide dehydrogenase (E3) component